MEGGIGPLWLFLYTRCIINEYVNSTCILIEWIPQSYRPSWTRPESKMNNAKAGLTACWYWRRWLWPLQERKREKHWEVSEFKSMIMFMTKKQEWWGGLSVVSEHCSLIVASVLATDGIHVHETKTRSKREIRRWSRNRVRVRLVDTRNERGFLSILWNIDKSSIFKTHFGPFS